MINFGFGILFGAVFALLVATFVTMPDSDAMKQCQQTHSHDTCFQILNR